jgi:phosphoribosylformylglycinamidine synthase subunit PurL
VEAVRATQAAVREAVRAGTLSSAHDIAEGGLAVALAECCLAGGLGAEVALGEDFWEATAAAATGPGSVAPASAHVTAALFGEGSGGFVVSGASEALRELGERAPLRTIGRVGEDVLNIVQAGAGAGSMLTLTLAELAAAHAGLGELFA